MAVLTHAAAKSWFTGFAMEVAVGTALVEEFGLPVSIFGINYYKIG
ncbi:hypothetical protein [Botryobacter ruber]|nr:hypothetical protein [Botryobacter ruber]